MNDFSLASVRVVDVAHVIRQQIPSIEDNELRGFLFGFCAGEHVYLAPHFSRDFYGRHFSVCSNGGFVLKHTRLLSSIQGLSRVSLNRLLVEILCIHDPSSSESVSKKF